MRRRRPRQGRGSLNGRICELHLVVAIAEVKKSHLKVMFSDFSPPVCEE